MIEPGTTLFEDSDDEDNTRDGLPASETWRRRATMVIAVTAVLTALVAAGSFLSRQAGSAEADGFTVNLHGTDVGRLAPGATVKLGSVQVGEVRELVRCEGELVAVLDVTDTYAENLSTTDVFQVTSLDAGTNVQITSVDKSNAVVLSDGAHVWAYDHWMPLSIPWSVQNSTTQVVIAAIAAILAAGVIRIFKSTLFWVILVGVIVFVVFLAAANGLGPFDGVVPLLSE